MSGTLDPIEAKRRKAFMYANRCCLSATDRTELVEMLLWRDVPSWASLTEPELIRLLDAFEGFLLISHLHDQARARSASTA